MSIYVGILREQLALRAREQAAFIFVSCESYTEGARRENLSFHIFLHFECTNKNIVLAASSRKRKVIVFGWECMYGIGPLSVMKISTSRCSIIYFCALRKMV